MFYASDLISQYLPWYFVTTLYIKNFSLPHWINYFGGYPLLAEGETGALSPINSVIMVIFPFPLSINLLYIVYLGIGILGMYLFLRQINSTKIASFLGGLIFVLSGYIVARYFQPSIIFTGLLLPLGFTVTLKSINRQKELILLACIIYLQVTAGHLQITFISAIAYLVFTLLMTFKSSLLLSQAFKTIAAIILGFGLSAAQILPTLKLLEFSQRSLWDPMTRFTYSLPPSHLITYIVPGYYGISKPGDDLGFTQFGGGFWELNLTIWTLPFLLSLIPLFIIKKKQTVTILVLYILWLFFLLLSFGGFFKPNQIIAHVPSFPFRAPARFLLVCTFAASSLSAYGFDILTKKMKSILKTAIFCLILTSIIIQNAFQLREYFVFEDISKVTSRVEETIKGKITTPLPLSKDFIGTMEEPAEYVFKREFQKGVAISLFSLLIILAWWKMHNSRI